MIFVFLSGVAGALFGMSYKLRVQLKLDYRQVLIAGGVWSLLLSAAAVVSFREPIYSLSALLIGVPYGVTLTLSMIIYFRVVEKTKLNISWTFIQLSVVVPFGLSVIAYGESISWREAAGIALIFATILLLGLARPRRKKHGGADARAIGGLFLAFLFTGLTQCFPKIYQTLPGAHPTTTVLLYASLGMILFAGGLRKRSDTPQVAGKDRDALTAKRRTLTVLLFSLYMSATRLAIPLFLLLALQSVKGAVVFPLRTMLNILLLVLASYLFYQERLKLSEALGIPVAIAAITLLTV